MIAAAVEDDLLASLGRFLVAPNKDRAQAFTDHVRPTVGAKASGLLALPPSWTPPFYVVTTYLFDEWCASDRTNDVLTVAAAEIVAACQVWRVNWTKGIILRSSAVSETLKDRGAYASIELPADYNLESVTGAISEVFKVFTAAGTGGSIAVIVQALAASESKGHVSNEVRVSKSINQWMWEIEFPAVVDGRFNSQRATAANATAHLLVGSNIKSLTDNLKRVCRWITIRHKSRSHLEWGLTKNALWIYQIDFEDDQIDLGSDPRKLLRAADDTPSHDPPVGSPWIKVDASRDTGWSKVDKHRLLCNGRALYPSLYYVTAQEALQAIRFGRDLAADVQAITEGRAVCRTDCTYPIIDKLNLPRTESVSPAEVVVFIVQTTSLLQNKGANLNEICFILHKFIPAKVAAWAVARPELQIVLIDTLWGLPDGLQYLPHDTFEFDTKRQALSSELVRYKPKFLQETETGDWSLQIVARRYTRTRSLGLQHLREVANESLRVAKKLNRPIQIMWFCDVPVSEGAGANVPWFMMSPESSTNSVRSSLAPGLAKIVVRNGEDLNAVAKGRPAKSVLVLDPEVELYRDNDFLDLVAKISLEQSLPILMTGSALGHAFYTLDRAGVSVRTETPAHSRVRQRQKFFKLVRDSIPAKIIDHGERVDQARIDKTESRSALVIKLFEESQELLQAISPDDVKAELADLAEVLRSLCTATGVDWADVQIAAEAKRATRGSFEQNVVLMETSWPRWQDDEAKPTTRVIPLSALAQVTDNGGEHIINFAAAAAKGADNQVVLTSGTKIKVSINKDGILVQEVDFKDPQAEQLEFPFS